MRRLFAGSTLGENLGANHSEKLPNTSPPQNYLASDDNHRRNALENERLIQSLKCRQDGQGDGCPKAYDVQSVAARRCAFFLIVFGNACPKRKAAAQETTPSAPHMHSGGPSVSARSEAGAKYSSRTEDAMAVAV